MSECLVIKLPGKATDNNLRKLDEFRFSVFPAGSSTGYSVIVMTIAAHSDPVKLRIIKGNGELSTDQGITGAQEFEYANPTNDLLKVTLYIKATTECLLGLENCKHIQHVGNVTGGATTYFFSRLTNDSPMVGFDIAELRKFKHCTNILVVASGQRSKVYGDIAVFKDFIANRISVNGTSDFVTVNVTGDISVFEGRTDMSVLEFDFTKVYGDVASLDGIASGLWWFRSRSANVGGNLNIFSLTMTTLYHSIQPVENETEFTFNFSQPTPKPNSMLMWDHVGGQLSGNFEDIVDRTKTAGININCGSVDSAVNIDMYEMLRRASNKSVTQLSGNFGESSTYSFSGSVSSVVFPQGIGIMSFISKNMNPANALEILNVVNRSTVPSGRVLRVQLRTEATSEIVSVVNQLQAKGYSVTIFPLI